MLDLPESLLSLLAKPDEMGRAETPMTPQDIEEFEQSQGVVLPDSLKIFWRKYGARELGNRAIFAFKTKVVFPNGKRRRKMLALLPALIRCLRRGSAISIPYTTTPVQGCLKEFIR